MITIMVVAFVYGVLSSCRVVTDETRETVHCRMACFHDVVFTRLITRSQANHSTRQHHDKTLHDNAPFGAFREGYEENVTTKKVTEISGFVM